MMRVDAVAWYLRPLFWIYGYGVGVLVYLWVRLLKLTCTIRYVGAAIPLEPPAVYCIWHHDLPLYFAVFNSVKKQVWMNHPAWYMKPIHVLLYLTGVKHICLGSSGNSGKEALQKVIAYLKQGYATTVASDGPSGPAQVLKPGVLWMSRDAQVPVVPLRFSAKHSIRLGGWDGKYVPFLFTTITVFVGEKVFVTEENMLQSQSIITAHLNGIRQ